MKYNAVDDKAGMSRYKSDAQRKAVHASKARWHVKTSMVVKKITKIC